MIIEHWSLSTKKKQKTAEYVKKKNYANGNAAERLAAAPVSETRPVYISDINHPVYHPVYKKFRNE